MNPVDFDLETFEKAISGDKPVLVDFWAPWCVCCRRIAPVYEKIAQQYADRLVVAKVNIDEQPLIANREHIEVIPTLVLFRGGQAVDFVVAPESKAKIEEFLEKNL